MQKITEKKDVLKLPIIKKVAIPETLALIPHGKTARYVIQDMNISSVRAQVSIINKRVGRKEYEVTVYDNGAIYDVKRN